MYKTCIHDMFPLTAGLSFYSDVMNLYKPFKFMFHGPLAKENPCYRGPSFQWSTVCYEDIYVVGTNITNLLLTRAAEWN